MMNEFSDFNNSFEEILGTKGRIKILRILAIVEEINVSKIVKLTGINHTTVKKHLDKLIEYDFIQIKQFGRIKIYRYKNENLKAQMLKNLIFFWEKNT